jgi:hypothetical protein
MKDEKTACGFANMFTFKWAVNCPPLTAHYSSVRSALSAISYTR